MVPAKSAWFDRPTRYEQWEYSITGSRHEGAELDGRGFADLNRLLVSRAEQADELAFLENRSPSGDLGSMIGAIP